MTFKASRRQVLLVSGSALLLGSASRGVSAQTLKDVSISLSSNSFATAALRLAERKSLFAKNGLNARLVAMDTANSAFAAMLGGSVQMTSSGAAELFAAASRGQEAIAVADIYRGLASWIILSKTVAEKTGVAASAPVKERLKAMDGLVFAAPSPTSQYGLSIAMAVKDAGSNLKLTYMAQTAMPAALESGAVQGYVAGTPYWVPPVIRGSGVVWIKPTAGELPYHFSPSSSGLLLATKAYARANPDVISAIARVAQDVGAYVRDDKDGALKDLAAIYPDLDSQTLKLGFDGEWQNWQGRLVTEESLRHDVEFLRRAGQAFDGIEKIDPRSLLPQ